MKSTNHRGAGYLFLFNLLLLVPFRLSSSQDVQDTQAKYQRKSVSYVNALLPIGDNVRLKPEQEAYVLKVVKQEIEMPRFDYNPLPDELVNKFKREIRDRRPRSLDDVASGMNDVLVPEIMRVLDYEKEMRAQGLVSEADRHSFVVEKAKETGITAEDLEAIMNSAYIYLPVVSSVAVQEDKDHNTVTAKIVGGILWFSVKTDESGSSVGLAVKSSADGSGFAKLSGSFSYEGRTLDGPQYAFATATKVFARNLKVATQQIPDFQLTNPLTETGRDWVEFGMGRKEGLGVDDKFIIAEFYEQPDGSLRQKNLGMVRVAKVADNRDKRADSKARVVIGGGYERGMLALEHPRLPIDLSFRFGVLPVNVDSGNCGDSLRFEDDITSNFYVGQLWFNYDLARSTGWSQFFASLYGEIGGGTLSGGMAFGEDLPGGLYWGVGGGLVKKFYANRFHIGLEALLSYADYRFSGTGADYPDWEWKIANLGMTLNGNLEIALGYDLNIGGGISYRVFAPSSDWTYKYAGNDVDLSSYDNLPELNFSGLGFQFFLTWSLPSLGYDPFAAARGAIGH